MRRACLGAVAVALIAIPTVAAGVSRWPSWLCEPGLKVNYCATNLATIVYWPHGTTSVVSVTAPKSRIDCFYVYPTVSLEQRGNADLRITRELQGTAVVQAARFSQVCRVFAPVYR